MIHQPAAAAVPPVPMPSSAPELRGAPVPMDDAVPAVLEQEVEEIEEEQGLGDVDPKREESDVVEEAEDKGPVGDEPQLPPWKKVSCLSHVTLGLSLTSHWP